APSQTAARPRFVRTCRETRLQSSSSTCYKGAQPKRSRPGMTTVPTSLRAFVVALLLLCVSAPLAGAAAPADAPASFDRGSVYIYAPSNAARIDQPLQVVFA